MALNSNDNLLKGRLFMKKNIISLKFARNILYNMTLKHQLQIMMWLFLLLFLFTQLLYTSCFLLISHRNSEKNNANLLQQVGQNIDNFCSSQTQIAAAVSSNKYVHNYMTSNDALKRYNLLRILTDSFSYTYLTNSSLLDIAIIDNQARIYGNQNIPSLSIWNAVQEQYHEKNLDLQKDILFDLISTRNSSYYVLCRPVYNNGSLKLPIGNCIITSSGKELQDTLNRLILTEHSMVFLVNSDNKILAAHDQNLINTSLDGALVAVLQQSDASRISRYNSYLYSIQQLYLTNSDWKLISLVPLSEISQPLIPVLQFGLILSGITLLLLLGTSVSIIHNITSSVNHLASQMEDLGKHGTHGRITIYRHNEIGAISVEINRMLDEIDKLNRNIFHTQSSLYEMELLKKEAEFLALQNQINPHFLYNTLECIRDIALVYQADEISSIAISITKIFRYCIKAENIVTIADEMDCIDDYINIIQVRYQNRFTIKRNIDPELLPLKMMKFLLQPIIENAIFHGLELKPGPGILSISGKLLEDSSICFEIRDNGIGIEKEKLVKMQDSLTNDLYVDSSSHHTGIGLLNIHNRIKNMYGEEYGLSIDSEQGKGTCVTIRVPQFHPSDCNHHHLRQK